MCHNGRLLGPTWSNKVIVICRYWRQICLKCWYIYIYMNCTTRAFLQLSSQKAWQLGSHCIYWFTGGNTCYFPIDPTLILSDLNWYLHLNPRPSLYELSLWLYSHINLPGGIKEVLKCLGWSFRPALNIIHILIMSWDWPRFSSYSFSQVIHYPKTLITD